MWHLLKPKEVVRRTRQGFSSTRVGSVRRVKLTRTIIKPGPLKLADQVLLREDGTFGIYDRTGSLYPQDDKHGAYLLVQDVRDPRKEPKGDWEPSGLEQQWDPEALEQVPAAEIWKINRLMRSFDRDDMRSDRDKEIAEADAENARKNKESVMQKDSDVMEGVGISEKLKREMKGGSIGIALSEGVSAGIQDFTTHSEEAAQLKREEEAKQAEHDEKKKAELDQSIREAAEQSANDYYEEKSAAATE